MKRHNATIAALAVFGVLLTPFAVLADSPAADVADQTPAPVQRFDFADEDEGDGAVVRGERDAPQIDWACGIVRAKHASLIEIPVKRFFPALTQDEARP